MTLSNHLIEHAALGVTSGGGGGSAINLPVNADTTTPVEGTFWIDDMPWTGEGCMTFLGIARISTQQTVALRAKINGVEYSNILQRTS